MSTTVLPEFLRRLGKGDERAAHIETVSQLPAQSATWRNLVQLALLLAIAYGCLLVGRSVVPSIAGMYALADSPHPYFVADHFLQFYVASPMVALSACMTLMAPGLLVALATGYARSVAQWVLFAFPISLLVNSLTSMLVQAVLGRPLVGGAFIALNALCSLGAFGFLVRQLRRGMVLPWPDRVASGATLMLAFPAVLLITLVPKFYWENFNGDGAHAFESARLLLHQSLPFWDRAAGEISAFPGLTSVLFAFPGSWFIRLFGDGEASARVPYLLYVVLLLAALWAVIDFGRSRRMSLGSLVLLCGALLVYTIALAFSATYSPYSADIALPATQDTLLMACFIGFIFAWLDRKRGFMAVFALLTYLSLPNGLLMLGFWAAAVVLVFRPVPWRTVFFAGALLPGLVVLSLVVPRLADAFGMPMPGNEYGIAGLLHRFDDLQFTDFRRIAFMAVPCGILPAAALLCWRWQDNVARAVTIVTAAMFVFFYVQAGTALHYYIPAMLLPLVVHWRLRPVSNAQRPLLPNGLTAAALLIALWLSIPEHVVLESHARTVGSSFEIHGGGYEQTQPPAFNRAMALHFAFPYDWNRAVPDSTYGGSPIVWNYYAHHPDPRITSRNYVVQAAAAAPPANARLAGEKRGWALYIRSDSVWQTHRALRPKAAPIAAIYEIDRAYKFR